MFAACNSVRVSGRLTSTLGLARQLTCDEDLQVCGLSGIVALFFTGICHAHYSYYNVTPDAQARLINHDQES